MQVLENVENVVDFVKNLGVGRRALHDPFLEKTHKQCKVFERKGVTVEDDEELCHDVMEEFPCNACSATFQNLVDFELHYHDCHHYVCAECKKWRPTARLLEIHVQETHDNFFKVLAERRPEYQCFVSECDVKFKDPVERREHCRAVHEFPKNYRYDDSVHAKTSKDSEKNETMETEESEPSKRAVAQIKFGNNHVQKTFKRVKRDVAAKESIEMRTVEMKPEKSASPVTMFIPRQVKQKVSTKTPEKKEINMMELGDSLPKIE